MLKNKNKPMQALTIISFIIGLVFGFFILYFWQKNVYGFDFLESLPYLMLAIAAVGIGILLGVVLGALVHELGHLIGGLAAGMKFDFFEILSLQIRSTNDGLSLHRNKESGLSALALGRVSMQIKEGVSKKGLRRHYSAGFIANALFSLLIFIVNWSRGSWVDAGIASFAVVNLYLFLTNALPMNQEEFFSDGDILKLLKEECSNSQAVVADGFEGTAEHATAWSPSFFDCQQIEAKIAGGMRPREIGIIRVEGSRPLVQVIQAMLGFIQAIDAEEYDRLAPYMVYIRPSKVILLNLDANERLAYCAIYDSWIDRSDALLREDFSANNGMLDKDFSDLGKIAQFFRDCYHYEEGIIPYPSRDELEENYNRLLDMTARDNNGGMGSWSNKLLQKRFADLKEMGQVAAVLEEDRV